MKINKQNKKELILKILSFTLFSFVFVVLFLVGVVSATYSTTLDLFDSEIDSETHIFGNKSVSYVNDWVVFYANYSSDDGYDIGQVLWESADLGDIGRVVQGFDNDNDGNKDDILVSETDSVYAFYNNGTQIWNHVDSTFDNLYEIATGDFDNNSQEDVAVLAGQGRLNILNGSTGEMFFNSTDYGAGYAMINGDVDGDGRQDDFVLGVSNVPGGDTHGIVAIIYNDSSGNFEEYWYAGGGTSTIVEIDISEIVGDENLIVFGDYSGGHTAVYYCNGTQKWITGDRGTAYSVDFYDQDSDGKKDEVITGMGGYFRVYNDTGGETNELGPIGYVADVEAIDLDGDGIYDDILAVDENDYAVYAYNSDLTLAWTFYYPSMEFERNYVYERIFNANVGDVNNDSIDEIIVGGDGHKYYILNLSGSIITKHYHGSIPGLTESGSYFGINVGESPGLRIMGDATGDGLPEIVSVIYNGYAHISQQVMCKINIGGFREEFMYYNYTSKLWEYYHRFKDDSLNKTIFDSKVINWNVSCEKGGYESKDGSSNMTVYLKNSVLNAFDQEEDSEDDAGWLSEDIVVANESTYFFANYTYNNSQILNNIGFNVEWHTDLVDVSYDLTSFDFDGDGIKEAFAYSAIDSVYAYSVDGDLLWVTPDAYYDDAYVMTSGDFDNDTYDEIVLGSSRGIIVILNGSDGLELLQTQDYGSFYSLEVGDINEDSVDDLIVGTSAIGSVIVYIYNQSTKNYENIWNATEPLYGYEIEISEINNGQNLVGVADTGNDKVYVYYANGTLAWNTSDLGTTIYDLDFIDYNSDGNEDEIVVGETNDIFVYNSSGEISRTTVVYEGGGKCN